VTVYVVMVSPHTHERERLVVASLSRTDLAPIDSSQYIVSENCDSSVEAGACVSAASHSGTRW